LAWGLKAELKLIEVTSICGKLLLFSSLHDKGGGIPTQNTPNTKKTTKYRNIPASSTLSLSKTMPSKADTSNDQTIPTSHHPAKPNEATAVPNVWAE